MSSPTAPKPVAMPSHNGIGLDQHQRRAPVSPELRQHDPEEPIACLQTRALRCTFGSEQLLPQGQILQHHVLVSTACQRQPAADQNQEFQHAAMVARVVVKINADTFWRTSVYCKRFASGLD
jgi:hypothetical protein